ncbi:mediator complex subunit med14, partial [Cystoisospora suis]
MQNVAPFPGQEVSPPSMSVPPPSSSCLSPLPPLLASPSQYYPKNTFTPDFHETRGQPLQPLLLLAVQRCLRDLRTCSRVAHAQMLRFRQLEEEQQRQKKRQAGGSEGDTSGGATAPTASSSSSSSGSIGGGLGGSIYDASSEASAARRTAACMLRTALLQYCRHSREILLKLYLLDVGWYQQPHHHVVEELLQEIADMDQQKQKIRQDALMSQWQLQQELPALLPPPPLIDAAVDLLSTGTYRRLPLQLPQQLLEQPVSVAVVSSLREKRRYNNAKALEDEKEDTIDGEEKKAEGEREGHRAFSSPYWTSQLDGVGLAESQDENAKELRRRVVDAILLRLHFSKIPKREVSIRLKQNAQITFSLPKEITVTAVSDLRTLQALSVDLNLLEAHGYGVDAAAAASLAGGAPGAAGGGGLGLSSTFLFQLRSRLATSFELT